MKNVSHLEQTARPVRKTLLVAALLLTCPAHAENPCTVRFDADHLFQDGATTEEFFGEMRETGSINGVEYSLNYDKCEASVRAAEDWRITCKVDPMTDETNCAVTYFTLDFSVDYTVVDFVPAILFDAKTGFFVVGGGNGPKAYVRVDDEKPISASGGMFTTPLEDLLKAERLRFQWTERGRTVNKDVDPEGLAEAVSLAKWMVPRLKGA